jgi:hypothetical protein
MNGDRILEHRDTLMTERDLAAVDSAVQSNPLAIAQAEGHLKKGLLILSEQIGLTATGNLVAAILKRLESEMPSGRTH